MRIASEIDIGGSTVSVRKLTNPPGVVTCKRFTIAASTRMGKTSHQNKTLAASNNTKHITHRGIALIRLSEAVQCHAKN